MTSRCQGLFPSRPQAREKALGTRLCKCDKNACTVFNNNNNTSFQIFRVVAKNRCHLNEFLRLPTTFNPSSPAQSSETDTGRNPRGRHNKSTTDQNQGS